MVYTATKYLRTGDPDVARITGPCMSAAKGDGLVTQRSGAFGYMHPVKFLEWLYRGADKSLARPGRKQATATKL